METKTLVVKVVAGSSAETNEMTALLMQKLQSNIENIKVTREKADTQTLDFGATLIAVIATPFAIELAKTLHAWLMKNNTAKLIIGKDREITAEGISREDLVEIVKEALGDSKAG
ncbi:hypothetical protein G3A43_07040 [Paraburkholderia aspalathi]|nr:hypothetical protein [Paraburkholderia aspalathi]MBK3780007.1 hypothetical protein [Paraburkholderia aspalathi]